MAPCLVSSFEKGCTDTSDATSILSISTFGKYSRTIVSTDDFDNPNGRWISENGVNWADMAEVVTPGYTFMIRAFFSTYDGVEQSFGPFAEVYPNPVCGTLHVVAEGLQKVDVFDLCGRLVLQSNESEIDMSSFLSGLYFLRVTTDKGVALQRVEVK